jgi:superfamily II DNA or RNA helicase
MTSLAPRQSDLFAEDQYESDIWSERLVAALSDTDTGSGLLSLGEEALAACPGDPVILMLATMAALFDARPQRALAFTKRLSKYTSGPSVYLLQALAFSQTGRRTAARALLERNGLTRNLYLERAFPVSRKRREWLMQQFATILSHNDRLPVRRRQSRSKIKARTTPGVATVDRASKARIAADATASAAPLPPLQRVDLEIPFTIEFDAAPLLSTVTRAAEQDGHWFSLRERFNHLSLAQGFDELLCLLHLNGVEPLLHQIETVRKVLKQFRGRVLLADEVGLGKTIEAGMVLKEYALRGMAERTLVLTPASLVGQWREELETKFGLAFATTYDPLLRDCPQEFWAQHRIVASLATARRRDHAERLTERQFDVIIVDEAHHLRDRSSQSWKLVDSLKKRFLLLLSATPVQNDLIELYNLLTLLKPGIFRSLKEFRLAYVTPGKPRQPANSERLRALMRCAMIRNTRAVVALKLPRRHATTIKVDCGADEAAAYADLSAAARRLAADGEAKRERLALQHLLSAAGSSPQAGAKAVARVAARNVGDPFWAELADRWAAIETGAKEAVLIDLLRRNSKEKKLVFVNSRDTLDHLADRLERVGILLARFDGSLSGADKDAAIAAFRDHAGVLLCTQSGGEGRNIQFCNTLINFDLPWNPMAIEQRIGRIDRIGQTREVFLFNLVTRGTLEERLLTLLEEKISMFELVVGDVGAILGSLDEEREFSDLVLDAWLGTTEAVRVRAFEVLGHQLERARSQHENAKALDEKLFAEDFEAT